MSEQAAQNMGVYDHNGVRVEHFPDTGTVEIWQEGPVATWTRVWTTPSLPADDDRTELADQLNGANESVTELTEQVSRLEAEVIKWRGIAQHEQDTWRQSAARSALQRDYERARHELRKLNDAMTRKKRVIAKRNERIAELEASVDWHATKRGDAVAELRQKQANIAATLVLIDEATSTGPHFLSPDETRAVVALLRGEHRRDAL